MELCSDARMLQVQRLQDREARSTVCVGSTTAAACVVMPDMRLWVGCAINVVGDGAVLAVGNVPVASVGAKMAPYQ